VGQTFTRPSTCFIERFYNGVGIYAGESVSRSQIYVPLQSVISWSGSVAPYYKIHISTSVLKIVRIGCYASLLTSEYLLETLLRDICRKVPYGFPCGSDDLPRWTDIDAHIVFLSCRERKRNCMVWVQLSMEGVAKRWPLVLPATIGQAQSDVQGHCPVERATYSCAKAQDTYDELNGVDGEGSRSGACL
jgi:hypothetical protein